MGGGGEERESTRGSRRRGRGKEEGARRDHLETEDGEAQEGEERARQKRRAGVGQGAGHGRRKNRFLHRQLHANKNMDSGVST